MPPLSSSLAPSVAGSSWALLRKGETFAAIRQLRQAEARQPGNGDTVLVLAYAYYLAGQKKLFAQKAARAAELLPKSAEPNYALGRYYLEDQQRRDLAEAEFRKALVRNPTHPAALYQLGWCLEQNQQTKEARDLYLRANSWLGKLGLARLALDSGSAAEALQQARSAATLQPNSPMVHAFLAKVHQRNGNCREAILSLQRAAALDPSDAAIFYQLSRCAAATGDLTLQQKSLSQYQRLQALYNP